MAFIGYPVSVALFGQEALFYAVILVLPFNLLSYSLGPLMLAGQAKFRWQQLLSPCIVASVIALMVALFHINMPALLGECLNFTGSLTTPYPSYWSVLCWQICLWTGIYFTPAVGSGGLPTSDPSHYAVAAPEVDRYRHTSGG